MAKPKAKPSPPSRRAKQAVQIRRLVVLDALRSWVVPSVAAGGIFVVWVLTSAELMPMAAGLTVAGGLILFIALHAALRAFIDERTAATRAALVGAFAVAWAGVAFYALYSTVNPPPPLFTSELKAQAPPVTVPLQGVAGSYRIVVEGHFLPSKEQASQSGHYRLRVADGTEKMIEGDFTEGWRRQRLGRRGSVPVHTVHALGQHTVDSASGDRLTLELTEVSAGIRDTVTVQVYRAAFSTTLLAAFGALLVAAALVIDAWRGTEPGDALMTMETLAVVLGIAAFRSFAPPRPSFGDLIVNGLLGAIAGVPAGALLWRLTRTRLRRLFAADR